MNRGFSLVELSIVLVILGLLTGGILAGQSLIRAAELRSINADMQRYSSALHAFQDKYFGLPGDIMNAESFWGSATGCPNGGGAHTGTETCNGDGNGSINSTYGGNMAATYSNLWEGFNAWQQMGNAGLVEGSFSGNYGSPQLQPGTNVPASKVSAAGFIWGSINAQQKSITVKPSQGANQTGTYSLGLTPTSYALLWGNTTSANALLYFSSGIFTSTVLKPEEVWNIDTKMDDGKPDYGRVQSGPRTSTCFTSTTSPTDYALTVTNLVCSLYFIAS